MPAAAPLYEPTVLASGQSGSLPPTQPAPQGSNKLLLLLAGGAFASLLGILVLLVILLWPKGGKTDGDKKEGDREVASGGTKDGSKADEPQVLIDEDFRSTYEKRRTLPEGWSSLTGAFRVVAPNDEPCLEVSTRSGDPRVKLPPVKLPGNFFVEGFYIVPPNHRMSVILESRKTNTIVPVLIAARGQVSIGDDLRAPPPTYKPYLPTHFVIVRTADRLKVLLNKDVAVEKGLGEVSDYDTIQLSMSAATHGGVPPRLFRLKVGLLGSDGELPSGMQAPDVGPKKGGTRGRTGR
jgi:hypothetical protein